MPAYAWNNRGHMSSDKTEVAIGEHAYSTIVQVKEKASAIRNRNAAAPLKNSAVDNHQGGRFESISCFRLWVFEFEEMQKYSAADPSLKSTIFAGSSLDLRSANSYAAGNKVFAGLFRD